MRLSALEICCDGALLTWRRRFLRARRFNPQEAFKQFKDTEDWRNQNDIVELYSKIDAEEYEATRRLVISSESSASAPNNNRHSIPNG